VKIVTIR